MSATAANVSTVTVTSVTAEDKQRKDGSGSFRVYTVHTTDGDFETYDRAVAERAHLNVGQPAIATWEDGKFARKLKDLATHGDQPLPSAFAGAAPDGPPPAAPGPSRVMAGSGDPLLQQRMMAGEAEWLPDAPPASSSAPSRQRDDGSPDWDTIAVQKTRCALWVALLHGAAAAGASLDMNQLAAVVGRAEQDIFGRIIGDDGIPF